MSESVPTPTTPEVHPQQGQLFDPTPPTPEQERLQRIGAAFDAANPNAVGDEPIKMTAPMSELDEAAHKGVISYLDRTENITSDQLPENVRLKRDWSLNERQHKEEEAKHLLKLRANLEGRLTASQEAREIQAYRDKVNAHNRKINARDSEQQAREAVKQAYLDDHDAAAKAEKKERAAVRRAHVNREKLLRGEAQAKLFRKEIREEAEREVQAKLGPAKYGKLTPEDEAELRNAADAHVEEVLGPTKHVDSVVDTEKLKSERTGETPSQAKNRKNSEALKDFQKGAARKRSGEGNGEQEDNNPDMEMLGALRDKVAATRNIYANLSAERGRRFGFGKKHSQKEVGNAYQEYENSRKALVKYERNMALKAGVSQEDLDRYAEEFEFAIGDAHRTATAIKAQRVMATGSAELDRQGNVRLIEPKTPLGRAAQKFYLWWGEKQHTNSKRFSRRGLIDNVQKSGVMAAAGFAVGVPAALAGSVLLGPVLGGAVGAAAAAKIARGVMAHHISRRSQHLHVEQLDKDLREQIGRYQGHPATLRVDRMVGSQVENERFYNRRRILASAAIAAAGGFAGQLFAHDILGLGSGHGGTGNGNSVAEHATHHKPGNGGNHGHGAGNHHKPAHSHANSGQSPKAHGNHGHGRHNSGGQPSQAPEVTIQHNGDTYWAEVHNYLQGHGYDASDSSVQKITQALVNQKGGPGWSGAPLAQVGDHLPIPIHALEGIHKVD